MGNVKEYKCPACGGALQFDSSSQKIKCPYCDAEFDVADLAALEEDLHKDFEDNLDWNASSNGEWSEEEGKNMLLLHCDSCGGELICDSTTAATSCPYCESPIVVKGNVSGDVKPSKVLPFSKTKEEAAGGLTGYFKGKLFLPKAFKREVKVEETKGIYVPFWIFDADVEGRVTFSAEDVRRWSDSNYNYKEVKHYRIVRGGNVGFEHIPVDGSKKMADDMMESIEPFDYKEVKPFAGLYLAGYLADRYDVSAKECEPRANERIRQGTVDAFRTTIRHYDSIHLETVNVRTFNNEVAYVLYPVWIVNTVWKENRYMFAMNGQSGKIVGNLPMSKLAYFIAFISWFFGVTAIGTLIGLLAGINKEDAAKQLLGGILIGAVIGLIAAIAFCTWQKRKLKGIRFQNGATNYLKKGSLLLKESRDIYLYRTVTKTRRQKN